MAADWSVRLGNPGGDVLAVALVLAFAALLLLGVRQALRVARPLRRLSLAGLRIATALFALCVALQPQWVGERFQDVEGRLAVLVDRSRSMSIRDAQETRTQRALSLLSDAPEEGAEAPLFYVFGGDAERVEPAALAQRAATKSDDTRIARALEQVVAQHGEELGAVLVVSDGADHSPGWSPAQGRPLGVRVHTLAIGGDERLNDEGILGLNADPVAFLRQEAEVEVTVRSTGPREQPLVVTLRHDGQVVSEAEVELTPSPAGDGDAAREGTVVLPFTPTRLGRGVYSVSVPVRADDAVPENNERAFLVRVTRDKLRVLLVCGAPSWDTRFLRAFLKADPSIDLITFFILRTASDLTMAPAEELSLIPFPTDELFREHLESFDLVIFQDFNYGPYQMRQYLPRIREYVDGGGAFAMIGGSRSFGAGGYERTELSSILPVQMAPGEGALVSGEFNPLVEPDNARHPVVELVPEPAENLALWSGLAPLVGANRLRGARDDAQVLLRHPRELDETGNPMPLLVVGGAGKGRTLAFGSDSSWRWGITTAGLTGDASAYERFWDRAVRWLSGDPLLEPARIDTDRERYGPGATLKAELRLRDARYKPVTHRELEARITDLDGTILGRKPFRSDGRGAAAIELLVPNDPGGYRIEARIPEDDTLLAEEGFVVESGGDELADPRPNPQLLRDLAQATGGAAFTENAPPNLSTLDRTRARSLGSVVHEPFASGWAFAALLFLFAAEWMTRRAWGLR